MLISTILSEETPALVAIPLTIVALWIAPNIVPDSMAISLITVLMYAILTLSWTMFSGPTGYISLATAGLFGVGVYLSAILRGHLPIEVVVLIGGLAAFLVALGIGLLTLKLKGVYFILFTFGVAALIRSSVQWFETRISGTVGRHVAGATNETVYLLLLILFAVTLIAAFLLKHSSPGLALQGIGQNQVAAEHIGVDVTRVKVLTFASSSVLIGMTGAVMATRFRYIDPNVAFNPLLSFLPVVMAILGGISKLYGPLLGSLILVALQEWLITEYPYVYLLIFGATLVVVVLWLPGGVVEVAQKGYIKAKIQWIKLRMRITRIRRERQAKRR
ncbi:MAG TPA: branched-chain amino acid ABC transporter permease [Acidimicrobiia bacterium]|nr:branched-chain amino acid ABC transporter permease [Acidimicrobiia bacterium]